MSAATIIPSRSPHAASVPDLREPIQDVAATQRRHLANLRDLADILTPRDEEPADPYACEICGGSTAAESRSGFALRSGAVVHEACLATQMEESR